jgi:hypothetical protein
MKKVLLMIWLTLMLAGCMYPHNFTEDPEGYNVYERCGKCGDTYEGGWHTGYEQHDPDEVIEAIENTATHREQQGEPSSEY